MSYIARDKLKLANGGQKQTQKTKNLISSACQVLKPGFIDSLSCFTFISGKRLKSNRILVQKMTKIST